MNYVAPLQLAVNFVFFYPVLCTIFVLEFTFRFIVGTFWVFPLFNITEAAEDFSEMGTQLKNFYKDVYTLCALPMVTMLA